MARARILVIDDERMIRWSIQQALAAEGYAVATVETGEDGDRVRFERTGVTGTLRVTPQRFELDATLGLLLGAFKGRIEAEITRQLDQMLVRNPRAIFEAGKKGHA